MVIRLMIIKLGKYNRIRELLIIKRTTGSQAQVNYQDGVWEAPVTMAAGDVNRVQGHMQLAFESGLRTGMCAGTAEQSEKN